LARLFEQQQEALPTAGHEVLFANNCTREDLYYILRQVTKQVTESEYCYFTINWDDKLNARTVEFINYTAGNSLGWHTDIDGTILTLVIMLSEPDEEYTGGEFELMDGKYLKQQLTTGEDIDFDDYSIRLDWHKGDFVIFPITTAHRVKEVLSGFRTSFVIEFRYGIDYGLHAKLRYDLNKNHDQSTESTDTNTNSMYSESHQKF